MFCVNMNVHKVLNGKHCKTYSYLIASAGLAKTAFTA